MRSAHSLSLAMLGLLGIAPAQAPGAVLTHGPFRGACDAETIHVWARAAEPGTFTLHLASLVDGRETTCTAEATVAGDNTLQFAVGGLRAGSGYEYWLTRGEQVVGRGDTPLMTAVADAAGTATVAFGSCSNERTFPEQPIWGQLLARSPQALVLLGDTPYIDDSSTEGRRRRYRAFFEFAPVRAALAAIPTWSTWDDHDYAKNDQFGAIKGSETARQVFLEHHAHDNYGNGTNGIYTSFRRGPLEVFVLDTRSFADTGPSVLAPGERTLLGKPQIEWLQRGLRGSSAKFKVLACGMVWNGGVRPEKKDCWGNWLPERDGLLSWVGAQRIDGVVLVGGDVHRSRVIVHPSQALAGYDVPELITSPLAQSVIETNAVAVPGLEFDAGEAHSCLLLQANVRGEQATLRATFVAGDGREFCVREFGLAALSKPDAAVSYRKIAALASDVFGADWQRFPSEGEPSEWLVEGAEAVGEPWRHATALAQPLFDEWAVAVAEPRCRLSAVGKDPTSTEFLDLILPIQRLGQLAVARGLQALADRQPERLVEVVHSLLAMARHLQQDGLLAWLVAGGLETNAAQLVRRATAESTGPEVAALRAEIDAHLAARPPLAAAAAAGRLETGRLFDAVMGPMRLGTDAQAATARQFGKEVRQEFAALLEPIYSAFAVLPDAPSAAQRAELLGLIDTLAKRCEERRGALKKLLSDGGKNAAEVVPTEDLALLLVSILCPNLMSVLDEQTKVLAALRAAQH